jgi:hypothetical protein
MLVRRMETRSKAPLASSAGRQASPLTFPPNPSPLLEQPQSGFTTSKGVVNHSIVVSRRTRYFLQRAEKWFWLSLVIILFLVLLVAVILWHQARMDKTAF